ncbi:hypothetical protein GCM10010082_16540 [Kushneria pakistanensis]|uniref:Penicillin-binding protein activator LpoB n=1 Tax=Kushneria pakistanensis TaxID=1508770 RepID=A0ABQ3FI86_9GAMM|nr:hypothetical protein [Kushneria pakistanensis]GHC24612.1 hypothetical protein GCM10010082_16540 [Kushneria pakistanensis]
MLLTLLMVGCAGMDSDTSRHRTPLENLGETAALEVLDEPPWQGATGSRVILVTPVQADVDFGEQADARFNDALTRRLLSARQGPQILSVADAPAQADAPSNQWRLFSTLQAPLGAITLSDRKLYPYTLTLTLKRGSSDDIWWQQEIDGALDERGLPLSAAAVTPAP